MGDDQTTSEQVASAIGQHTPGPWAVARSWTTKVVPLAHQSRGHGGSIYPKEDRDRFAHVIAVAKYDTCNLGPEWAHRGTMLEAKANAMLIAAAPDMLAALKAADRQTFCDCLQSDGSQIENSRTHHEPECWVPMLRAAIAKATGTTSGDR